MRQHDTIELLSDESALVRNSCSATSSGDTIKLVLQQCDVFGRQRTARPRRSSSPGSLWLWQDTHLLCLFFVLFDDHEGITTPSSGRAALRGESGCSLRKAPPWAAAPATRSAGSADIVAEGLGSGNALSRHTPHSSFFPSVSSAPQVVTAPARSGWAALGLGCCRSDSCSQAFEDTTSVYILFQIALFSEVVWAAAPGPLRSGRCARGAVAACLRSAWCVIAAKTHATISFSYWPVVVVRAYFVFECSGARFVCRESAVFLCLHPFEIIGFGGRGILPLIGVHVPSPEVHFVCRCAVLRFFCVRAVCTAVSLFFAAESASSYH